jgi:hypothetical protein
MWNAIVAKLLGVSKQLIAVLAPLLSGALAELLRKAAEKAGSFVQKAAADPSLLSGEARHAWVVQEVLPLLSETAKDVLPAIREAVVNIAVKSVYEQLKSKGVL